ncbi:hypothetical protein CaCOL14_010630 [Colletotrichum acutatum]
MRPSVPAQDLAHSPLQDLSPRHELSSGAVRLCKLSTLDSQRVNLGVSRLENNKPGLEGGHKSRLHCSRCRMLLERALSNKEISLWGLPSKDISCRQPPSKGISYGGGGGGGEGDAGDGRAIVPPLGMSLS